MHEALLCMCTPSAAGGRCHAQCWLSGPYSQKEVLNHTIFFTYVVLQVLLVGGATRMPSFRRFITNATGLRPRDSAVDPDEVWIGRQKMMY